MYVHVDRYNLAPGSGRGHPDPAALAAAASLPGLAGFLTLRQVAGTTAVRLTWWDTESAAASLPGLPTGPGGPANAAGVPPALTGKTYEARDILDGPAAGQAPGYARLVYFDGPRAPEQAAAEELAGERRIWPAVHDVSGLIRICGLRGRDSGSLTVVLATSVEALEATTEAIMATQLLPEEDPALLPGPDRVELHQVTGHRLPAATSAAATGRH
jgi:hypothetical protein